jgi:hypothetical protein
MWQHLVAQNEDMFMYFEEESLNEARSSPTSLIPTKKAMEVRISNVIS